MIANMERETGIEPVTSSLGSWRSTAELLPLALRTQSLASDEGRDKLATLRSAARALPRTQPCPLPVRTCGTLAPTLTSLLSYSPDAIRAVVGNQ